MAGTGPLSNESITAAEPANAPLFGVGFFLGKRSELNILAIVLDDVARMQHSRRDGAWRRPSLLSGMDSGVIGARGRCQTSSGAELAQ